MNSKLFLMKIAQIFLVIIFVLIFFSLKTESVLAGCTWNGWCVLGSAPCSNCPGCRLIGCSASSCGVCDTYSCGGSWPDQCNSELWTCDRDDVPAGCGGGGGDTTPPICGVEIEPSVTGDNLVMNPSFEGGAKGLRYWTSNSGLDRQLDGTFWGIHKPHTVPSMEVYDTISQDIPVQKGAIYFVRVWATARFYQQEGDKNWGVARFSVDGSYKVVVVEGVDAYGWRKFEGTFVAKDRTMTLALIADWAGDNSWYTEVAFDDILVKKIAGADSASSKDVKLKIGVWDDRAISQYRIRNQGKAWGGDESWQDVAGGGNRGFGFFDQSFNWTLSNSYGVDVELRDAYANKSETCSDTITYSAPDLIVSDFQIMTSGCASLLSPACAQPGESLCARVTVQNIGKARASGSYTGFRKIGGAIVEVNWIFALDPGQTRTKDFSFIAPNTEGTYSAKAWADHGNSVDEIDENNNTATTSYCVEAAPCPSCPSWLIFNDVLRGDGNYNKLLQWPDIDYEEGYRIYRCSGVGCSPTTLVTTVGVNVTSYTDTNSNNGFAPGTTLVYEIRPFATGCPVLNCPDYRNDIPTCVCGSWQNAGCGGWTCSSNEMYQVQFCFWSDGSGLCNTNRRCVADPNCFRAWLQTQEGDVHAKGNITVPVADGEYFSEDGSGGTPGVVSYETGTPDFSPGRVSSTGWLANTNFSRKNYDYFYQLLGSPTVDNFNDLNSITADGIYYSADNVDINAGFPGGRKAMVLVNGNVDIKTNIDVPIGSFLAIIASGKIDIADSVSRVEGIFIADGAFDAGTAATALTAEGMFVANSFDLDGRDLGALNESTPAIKFIYRPDLWLNAPAELLIPSYTWQELAP